MNGLESEWEAREAASLLGERFARDDLQNAEPYAARFEERRLRGYYRNSLAQATAQTDPQLVLDAMLDGSLNQETIMRSVSAFRALSEKNVELAVDYLEQIDDREQWAMFADVLAPRFADRDPDRALAWAHEKDDSRYRKIYTTVLETIALTDPQRAFVATGGGRGVRTARSDPIEAERILRSFDLPERETEQFLHRLNEMRSRAELAIYPGYP